MSSLYSSHRPALPRLALPQQGEPVDPAVNMYSDSDDEDWDAVIAANRAIVEDIVIGNDDIDEDTDEELSAAPSSPLRAGGPASPSIKRRLERSMSTGKLSNFASRRTSMVYRGPSNLRPVNNIARVVFPTTTPEQLEKTSPPVSPRPSATQAAAASGGSVYARRVSEPAVVAKKLSIIEQRRDSEPINAHKATEDAIDNAYKAIMTYHRTVPRDPPPRILTRHERLEFEREKQQPKTTPPVSPREPEPAPVEVDKPRRKTRRGKRGGRRRSKDKGAKTEEHTLQVPIIHRQSVSAPVSPRGDANEALCKPIRNPTVPGATIAFGRRRSCGARPAFL